MKHLFTLCAFSALALLPACNKEVTNPPAVPQTYSIEGKAQKGPYISGTSITLNELSTDLVQTGTSFSTSISSNDGSFSLNDLELSSQYALLTANGFHFSEIYGELSGAQLTLQAITDLNQQETVNVNVMTHLIRPRILNLVNGGLSFEAANEQAKSELFTYLGVTDLFTDNFETLDISQAANVNGVLLAFSVILQRYTLWSNEIPGLTAELTELLANMSADFADNGLIDDDETTDQLLANISNLNLIDIRGHIESRYADLGLNVTIPNFEFYINKFQQKHSNSLATDFTYPSVASPWPQISPNSTLPNVLVPANTEFSASPHSLAAIIPINASLKIKVIGGGITVTPPITGWDYTNTPEGFTLIAGNQNELLTMLVHLENGGGSATIEYYENNMEVPTFTKGISWD